MSLYRYFMPVTKNLPDLEGPLSDVLPSSTIKAANDAILAISKQRKPKARKSSKRGSYIILTGVQQTEVAFSHGNQVAIRRYSEEYSTTIKDSCVSTWKSKYTEEFGCKQAAGEFEENGDILYHRRKEAGHCFWVVSWMIESRGTSRR